MQSGHAKICREAKSDETKKLSTHYNNLNTSIKEMNENYRVISEKLDVLNVLFG